MPSWTLVPPLAFPLSMHVFKSLALSVNLQDVVAFLAYHTTPILILPLFASVKTFLMNLLADSFKVSIFLSFDPLILSFILPDASKTRTISLSFWTDKV